MTNTSNYTFSNLQKELTAMRKNICKQFEDHRIYFDLDPVLRVHSNGASLQLGYRVSNNITEQQYTSCAI